ncbi:MAG: D-glycero-beta-D-manno-heptose 1-phosphate adenylyltransferase [Candidatus Aenigmarchaeota archaeon]|nr:D-glycero-beta-D-manno-heptose 1-phosphate adenylyltransferase [Candidatus Aenigmarchaeota archaeon]
MGLWKIKNLEQLENIVKILKSEGKTLVTTNGCFDILHVGHVRYLQEARNLGDVLIVGVNSDMSVKNLKGPTRPIVPQQERLEMLTALGCVNYVFVFDEPDPTAYIERLKPHIHVKGGDYNISNVVEKEIVESYGGKIHIASYVQDKSTTNIFKEVLNRHGGIKNER